MRTIPEKEELLQMYNEQKLTMSEMGSRLGVSYGTIFKWMERYAIPRRDRKEALSGKVRTLETRQRISESRKGPKHPNFGKKAKIHGKRHWYTCPNGRTVSMRSNWEVWYAEYLREHNIDFCYEVCTFYLSDGSAYTPDFYLPESETFVEVKGWLTPEHKRRIQAFREKFPNKRFVLADKTYLETLGIDLRRKWISTRPVFQCNWCHNDYHRFNPSQRFCSVTCRNNAVANGYKLDTDHSKPKRRYTKGDKPVGRRSNLTPEQVLIARKLHQEGCTNSEIARRTGITPGNVSNIVHGKSWTHIK